MRMLRTALSFGVGYAVGRPGGRARLTELIRGPQATRWRERGSDLAGAQMRAVLARADHGSDWSRRVIAVGRGWPRTSLTQPTSAPAPGAPAPVGGGPAAPPPARPPRPHGS